MIHYISAGRADLNLGKAINGTIKHFPEDDWICLMDIDTMPGYHEVFFKQVEDISKTDFGIVGCIVNRLGLKYQLHLGELSNNTDWKHHREIAKLRYKEHGSKVEVLTQPLAGVFMLFPKKTWTAVGGFVEGGIINNGVYIDNQFSRDVEKQGFKAGIANGIYLIHMYRPDAVDVRYGTKHLVTPTI